MNEQEQRIAIVDACGWWIIHNPTEYLWKRRNDSWEGGWEYRSNLPDYLHDLNAMHEAEKVLEDDSQRWQIYLGWLFRITNDRPDTDVVIHVQNYLTRNLVRATAAMRAEAFLRTLGKWRDDAPPPPTN